MAFVNIGFVKNYFKRYFNFFLKDGLFLNRKLVKLNMSTTLRNGENHQPVTAIGLSTIKAGAASSAKELAF
jgi:hypothetical protein